MENLKKIEFGEIAELRKEKFNPLTSNETKPCLELEHFEQVTGKINGYVFSSEQKSIKNVFYKGDILFGKLRPYLKKYWLAEFDGVCSSEVWVLKPKTKEITNEYLFRLIQTNEFIQAANVSSGSKMPRADWDYINNYPFSINNSKSEQKAIAQVLSTWDKAIHQTEQLIAQKEQGKKWLMQQLLTGKKRLKGFEKSKAYHKTDLGLTIPLDWAKIKVKDLFSERKETSKDQLVYPLYSLTIENGLTEKTDRYERSFLLKNKDENLYKLIYPNDILFNPMNLRFGAIAKSKIEKIVSVSAYYNSIFLKKESNADIDFYESLFKTPVFFNLYDRIAIGSLIEKKRVHLSSFIELEVPLPSKEEQTAIAQVLEAADKEISLLKAKAEKLREQKKGLMQVLLTGRVRVRNFEN
ncbi:MAG: restriction endonuclease subunit S [Cecembia sp.]